MIYLWLRFKIIKIQQIVINTCNKITTQILKITHTHIEVIKEVHRNLTFFNRNNMELLHIVKFQQRESKPIPNFKNIKWTILETVFSYWNGIMTIDKKKNRMWNTIRLIVTSLAPSFCLSRVTRKPIYGLLGTKGLLMSWCQGQHFMGCKT